jgi:hypothetical protein
VKATAFQWENAAFWRVLLATVLGFAVAKVSEAEEEERLS